MILKPQQSYPSRILHQGQTPHRGTTHREPRFLKLSIEHLKLPGMDKLLKIKSPLQFGFCIRRRPDYCLGCQGRVSYAEFRKELYKERHKEMTQIVANRLSDFSRGLQ